MRKTLDTFQDVVLTLLILENGLGEVPIVSEATRKQSLNPSYSGKRSRGLCGMVDEVNGALCLNPSYSGKRSRGRRTNRRRMCAKHVLTLLILENGLGAGAEKFKCQQDIES